MAERPSPMDEEDLVSILRKEEQASELYQTGTLSSPRVDALDYYDRNATGDLAGEEGSSQVITSEFADAIESIMPGMMEVFTGGDQVVEFTPSAPGEEKMAEEATQYVTHCFMVENNGFQRIHDLVKDALMFRLGGLSVDLEDKEEIRTVQAPPGLTQDGIDIIIAEAQKSEAELEMDLTADVPAPVPTMDGIGPGGALGGGDVMAPSQTFSGTITVKQKRQKVVAKSIAPEDIRFTPTARDQDEASFLGFLRRTTASELVQLGLSQDDVDDLRSDKNDTIEEAQRNDNAVIGKEVRDIVGDSERPLWLVVAYVRVDANGDGISEMLRVVYAHSGGLAGKIIEQEEWEDGIAPIALASPILMPHALVGRSLFDQTKDIQLIKTVLTRGMLDNMNFSIRPRAVLSDQVNLDSFLDWVPGAPIRLKPGAKPNDGHVAWEKVPSVMAESLQGLEYFSTVMENRTGTSRHNQGLDAESLNKTKGGMQMLMSAAQQRQKLIARVLAETAISRIYRLVYKAIKRAAKGPTHYWAGKSFKTVDPSKWPNDMDLTVNVGLGTGNTQQELEHLSFIAQIQEKLVMLQGGTNGPFVTGENLANTSQKMAEKLGFKTPGMFFQPPEVVMQTPPGEPKPDPEMAKVQGQLAAQKAKQEGEMLLASAKAQAEAMQRQEQARIDLQLAREKAAADMQIARERAALDMQIAREKAALDAQLKMRELQQEAVLGAMEIESNEKVQGAAQQREQEVS
jgi:hypothetical protein